MSSFSEVRCLPSSAASLPMETPFELGVSLGSLLAMAATLLATLVLGVAADDCLCLLILSANVVS